MADRTGSRVVDPVSKDGYVLEFEDSFDGDAVDESRCCRTTCRTGAPARRQGVMLATRVGFQWSWLCEAM